MIQATGARASRFAPETLGILGMLGATAFFALMDASAKALTAELPALQVVWARYVAQTLIVIAICLPQLRTRLKTANPWLQMMRSISLFGATGLFFVALGRLELVEAVALLNTGPLMIVAMAGLVLGESVGPRRWAAVVIGLIGALIIIRPGLGVFQPGAVFGIGAAFFLALYQITTRMVGGADGIWTTMLYTTSFGAIVSSVAMPWVWQVPSAEAWLLMVVIGVVGMIGQLCIIWGLSKAAASTLAPFNYSSLIWASLTGYLIFRETPDAATWLGAAVIVGAGLYVWHRERQRGPNVAGADP